MDQDPCQLIFNVIEGETGCSSNLVCGLVSILEPHIVNDQHFGQYMEVLFFHGYVRGARWAVADKCLLSEVFVDNINQIVQLFPPLNHWQV